MKIYILAAPLLALAACDAAPPQNNVVDVASNNMIADDVTEVDDDSASAPSNEAEVTPPTAPPTAPLTQSEMEDESVAKKDRGEQ